ncbi:Lpg0189 family type II secretion system effector [Legionella sp. W05-934-2]|uniref:Lpg0189 family type II secretion system effector n=1 Tax=Legionella TaxID=445 RepID=UPI00346198A7
MRQFIFSISLALLSNSLLANPTEIVSKETKTAHSFSSSLRQTYHFSKSKSDLHFPQDKRRTKDFPTQIIRLKVDFSNYNLTCDEIEGAMYRLLTEKLDRQGFTFTGGSACWASIDGAAPNNYRFDIYFDPQTDKAISFLKKYIAKYNGTDFYGVPFNVESAKGVVVSLNVDTGIVEDSDSSIFKVLFHINGKIYFNNKYDVNDSLIQDIESKMTTNDPLSISSFIKQWMGSGNAVEETSEYLTNLAESNKVLIDPEYIFLMDNEPKIYTLSVDTTYTHECKKYPSKKCLG